MNNGIPEHVSAGEYGHKIPERLGKPEFKTHLQACFYIGADTEAKGHASAAAVCLAIRTNRHTECEIKADTFEQLRWVCREWLAILDELEQKIAVASDEAIPANQPLEGAAF